MPALPALGLLYPGALYFLAIVPALVIPYLARERPRRVIVSSVLAFRALHIMRGERFGGRPRFNWNFFIELLILCLAALAMGSPYLVRKGNPLAVIIDNSAPMQTRMAHGKSRFELARTKAAEALEAAGGSGEVAVYLTTPQLHQVAVFSTIGAAASAIDRAQVTDAPDDPAAISAMLARLASNRRIGRIIFASYRGIAPPIPARLDPIVVNEPDANYAIGSFALSRESLGATALHAQLSVANFSPNAQDLKVTITGDGKPAGTAQAKVSPGEVTSMDFANLAPAQVYRAQLEPADAFRLDNVAYATGGAVKAVSILFISPTPNDGDNLSSVPGVAVTVRTPDAYSPKDLATADLAIFEYTAPKDLPTVNALLVMPPPGDPVFDFAVAPAAHLALTSWPTTDPLTGGVNFRLLAVHSGEYFSEHPWMRAVVNGADGGLMLAGERQGRRFVATGFNPFPYLGAQNLPMSILTLNLLSYLAGFGAQATGFRTGEPWIVPAGVNRVTVPAGVKHAVQPGSLFTGVGAQGIYELGESAGGKTLRAVNLADLTVSDLEDVLPLKVQATATGEAQQTPNVRTSLAPYILAAIIALVIFEAILVYRQRPFVEA